MSQNYLIAFDGSNASHRALTYGAEPARASFWPMFWSGRPIPF